MVKNRIARILVTGGIAASILLPHVATAVDWNITGFLRQEIAVSITDQENPYTTWGNPWTHRIHRSIGAQAITARLSPLATAAMPGGDGDVVSGNTLCGLGGAPNPPLNIVNACDRNGDGINDLGNALESNKPINLFATRGELDIQTKWNRKLSSFVKIRTYFEGTSAFTDAQIGDHFRAGQGFYQDTDARDYDASGNILEWHSPDFMIDIPSFYFDYNSGPLWLRIGQQQIAWGEAYFFRVFDVPNGLDLRRHLTLDVGAEEYSDKRMASPGIRASYTFNNGIEIDAFMQMFAPTALPPTNTPYSPVFAGFSWSDATGEFDEAENSLNFGIRVNWPVTDNLTLSAMAVNRRNPDGVARWDDAPLTYGGGTPNANCYGPNNANGQAIRAGAIATAGSEAAAMVIGSNPFSNDFNRNGIVDWLDIITPLSNGKCGSSAINDQHAAIGAGEWYWGAPNVRLDPATTVQHFVKGGVTKNGSSAAELVVMNFGLPSTQVPNSQYSDADSLITLDAFTGLQFSRGFITREFKRENIFGFAANYLVEATPGSWLDQLIIRGEMTYTPDKKFTELSFGKPFIEEDEFVGAVILEKYHNVVPGIPATYLVAQWMTKTESDLFGRHLSGNGIKGLDSENYTLADPYGSIEVRREDQGEDMSHYVSFAFQQPFPNLIWRFDFAMLIDINGGFLLQPGLKYKPSSSWQFDIYANIIQSGGSKNNDVMETLDWADEVFVRASYYF